MSRAAHRAAALAALLALTAGCEPTVAVGTWACAEALPKPDAGADAGLSPLSAPWHTGFEDGFCGYADVGGYCYADEEASQKLVTSPVRSGRFAAAFTVDSSVPDTLALQARCVRYGELPSAAYYGAWYLIPEVHVNAGNWNLFHFQGGETADAPFHGLWDVSLVNEPGGGMHLSVFDFLGGANVTASLAPPIPIGSWFHVEMYFARAADATGEVTVYQDGVVAHRFVDVVTDDSAVGAWYVGNLASALSPSLATAYVDDIAIRAAR